MTAQKHQLRRRQLLAAGAMGTGVAAATMLGSPAADAAVPGPVPVFTDGPGQIVVPYRAFDSRSWPAAQGGGRLSAGQLRTVVVNTSVQGPSADHVFLTVTVTGTAGGGYLTIYPADRTDIPHTSTINWQQTGLTLSTGLLTRCEVAAVGPLLRHQSRLKIRFVGTGQVDVILDVAATFGSRTI